ncbi:MAG: general secretion pathway protein GspB [bacterium]|nr:general secretion pathway protein GspB [bacterium]
MLNNKYLAIVLVVAALLLVVYQVFFNKRKPTTSRQVNQAFTQSEPAAGRADNSRSRPQAVPKTAQPKPENDTADAPHDDNPDIDIDYDSPLLLQKVSDNPIDPYPKRKLSPRFGSSIFINRVDAEPAKTGNNKEIKHEVRFKLNSTISEKDRRLAVVNGTLVQEGQIVSGAEVVSIRKGRVVLRYRGKQLHLTTSAGIKEIKAVGGKSDR